MQLLEGMSEQLYSDGTCNTFIWDDTFEITTVQQIEFKGVKVLYVLNDVETQILRKGFRYIKQLLLQSHNLRMCVNHQTLNTTSINVYSVITDAFTFGANNLELAKPLLKFNNTMGSWRVSHTEDMYYPRPKFI